MPSPAINLILRGSRTFQPDKLSGLAAWYSADFGVLNAISPDTAATDGQTVRRWLDRSANARHLDQATLATQPVFSATGLGGLPAIQDNGAVRMSVAAATSLPVTFYVAGRWGGTSSEGLWMNHGSFGSRSLTGATGTNFGWNADGATTITDALQTSQPFVARMEASSASKLQINLRTVVTSAVTATTPTGWGPFVGTATNSGNLISEAIIYYAAHSDSDAEKVVRYLAKRWGVSL